jgi:hypothetical protein
VALGVNVGGSVERFLVGLFGMWLGRAAYTVWRKANDAFRDSAFVVAAPRRLRSHILSDFISATHSPFKSLVRLLLRHTGAGRLACTTPCRQSKPAAPGAHLAHGTEQRTQSGGLELCTDHSVTVETSLRPVDGLLCTVFLSCWSTGLAGRIIVAPISSARGESLLGGGALATG